jgi:hypothetical protein
VDSFLLTHSVNDFLFDVGSPFTPIGIRDQMVRGFLIATRLLAEKKIGPALPLLVVGAGAAGATAALIAATNDVPTIIVDRQEEPFSRQLYCPTRYLSPSEYDWPAARWRSHRFPGQGLAFPFGWSSNYAAVVAASWRAKLYREARVNDNLQLRLSWHVRAPEDLPSVSRDADNLLEVTIEDDEGNTESEKVAVVVACTGPGKEQCSPTHGEFVGISFWEPDTLQENGFGLSGVTHPRIFLSGGGDGVLQDFLRVVTNVKSAGDVLAALPDAIQTKLSNAIIEAEEQFTRGSFWNTTKYNCRAGHILHKAYQNAVEDVFTNSSSNELQVFDRQLSSILKPIPDDLTVQLVHPCSHFTTCYPLNRMLVLLVNEFIKRRRGIDLIEPYTQVLRVRSQDGHDCALKDDHCRTSPHYVDLAVARCSDIRQSTRPVPRPGSELYHHVILRHGILPTNFFGQTPRGNPKEILPAYVDLDWY